MRHPNRQAKILLVALGLLAATLSWILLGPRDRFAPAVNPGGIPAVQRRARPAQPVRPLTENAGKLVHSERSPASSDGSERRIEWIETGLKYPLIRREELWQNGQLVQTIEMVADHLVVKVRPGHDEEFFAMLAQQDRGLGLRVRDQKPISHNYLIAFDPNRAGAMETVLAALEGRPDLVESASPDRVVRIGR